MFFVKTPTESSSLSGAPHRFIACYSACDAESKDPGGAFRTDAAGRLFGQRSPRTASGSPRCPNLNSGYPLAALSCPTRITQVCTHSRRPTDSPFPRLISVGEFDPLGNGGMRRLEDEEESIPFGRNITGLNIPDEHRRGLVILMSQFKTEAVGFELDMPGEQIEKRQNGNPRRRLTGTRSAERTPGRKVR